MTENSNLSASRTTDPAAWPDGPSRRTMLLGATAAGGVTTAAVAGPAAATTTSGGGGGKDDVAAVTALHTAWVYEWDRERGAGYWNLREAMDPYYRWGSDESVLLYDDMDPEDRTARSPEEYRTYWEPAFNALDHALHTIPVGPLAEVSGDLASSWVVFGAVLQPVEGDATYLRSTNVLLWRRFPEGWRIVRDHTSSVRITREESDRLFAEFPPPPEPAGSPAGRHRVVSRPLG